MLWQLSCLKVRKCAAHVRHKFRLSLLIAVFTLSLGELIFFVFFALPLIQLWPGKEMLCKVGAAAASMAASLRLGQVVRQLFNKVNEHNASAAPQPWDRALSAANVSTQVFVSLFWAATLDAWCALLLLAPAALDLLLLLLHQPKGLLASPQLSAEVAVSSNFDLEEYQVPNWRLRQQRNRSLYVQAVEFKNFTWPSGGVRALDGNTRGFEVNTCLVCVADFVPGELLSSLPCGHSFLVAVSINFNIIIAVVVVICFCFVSSLFFFFF
ncbi:unnamed protein product [Polarella glacialis]|uniref:Uncharacterized protein n=1 Tax=Polarella glacialis TaxID=89957 RepID=A0A813HLD2_POLGL|nr:unnamed protein product [Polarella glacialis]